MVAYHLNKENEMGMPGFRPHWQGDFDDWIDWSRSRDYRSSGTAVND